MKNLARAALVGSLAVGGLTACVQQKPPTATCNLPGVGFVPGPCPSPAPIRIACRPQPQPSTVPERCVLVKTVGNVNGVPTLRFYVEPIYMVRYGDKILAPAKDAN